MIRNSKGRQEEAGCSTTGSGVLVETKCMPLSVDRSGIEEDEGRENCLFNRHARAYATTIDCCATLISQGHIPF